MKILYIKIKKVLSNIDTIVFEDCLIAYLILSINQRLLVNPTLRTEVQLNSGDVLPHVELFDLGHT